MADQLFLFDGDCAFCTSAAAWLARRAPEAIPVLAWQHVDLEQLGVPPDEVAIAVVLTGPAGRRSGASAISALLAQSPGATWRLAGRAMDLPGVRHLAAVAYRWVAANRHRLPGGTPACALPPPAGSPAERADRAGASAH